MLSEGRNTLWGRMHECIRPQQAERTHTVQVRDKDQAEIEVQMEPQVDRDGYLYASVTLASL